ncbi:MAG: peptidylprolyl isomerase, partial [Pseudomonadota bacterium]
GAIILVFAFAETIVENYSTPPTIASDTSHADPVLIEVGETALRVSDVRAQAVLTQRDQMADRLSPKALIRVGLADEAADQAALAMAATTLGLNENMDVKAQLALAERRILSSAYLDQMVEQRVNERVLKALYKKRAKEAFDQTVIQARRILVSSHDEAEALRKKIDQGISFGELVQRQSLDPLTVTKGGHFGPLALGTMPADFASAMATLPLGAVSAPIRGDNGWYILRLESRSGVRYPPFLEVRDRLEAELTAEIVHHAIQQARSSVSIRLAEWPEKAPVRTALHSPLRIPHKMNVAW